MQSITIDSNEKLESFMQWFSTLNFADKSAIMVGINNSIAYQRSNGKSEYMLLALKNWCGMNMTVGAELCNPTLEMFDHFYSTTIAHLN